MSKGFEVKLEGSELEGRTEVEVSIQGYSVLLAEASLEMDISVGMVDLLGLVLRTQCGSCSAMKVQDSKKGERN